VSRQIDTVLVKAASRCNLDCSYCYVYNLGDDGWKDQPRRMPDAVMDSVIDQLGEFIMRNCLLVPFENSPLRLVTENADVVFVRKRVGP